jgi:hypothetical protein
MGTFPQTLACASTAGSATPTPAIDENCNGFWDDSVAGDCLQVGNSCYPHNWSWDCRDLLGNAYCTSEVSTSPPTCVQYGFGHWLVCESNNCCITYNYTYY